MRSRNNAFLIMVVLLSLCVGIAGCGDSSSSSHESNPVAQLDPSDPNPPSVKVPPSPSNSSEVKVHRDVMNGAVKSVKPEHHFNRKSDGTIELTERAKHELHPSVHNWVDKTVRHLNANHKSGAITIHPDYRLTIHSKDFLPESHKAHMPPHHRMFEGIQLALENQIEIELESPEILLAGVQPILRDGTCNNNGWVAQWWGWQLFIDHDKAELIETTADLISEVSDILSEIPVIGEILVVAVKAYFGVYHAVIHDVNGPCGVILAQAWVEYLVALWFPPAALLMWVSPQ